MSILVTGGTGYIGSHTCVELIKENYDVIIVDNLYNSSKEALNRINTITGVMPKFYEIDLLDKDKLNIIFEENNIEAVIHFAGYKAVGESCSIPLTYYQNNITTTLNLCEVMKSYNCKKIVFSSSATVYGDPASVPIDESFPLSTTNPYGTTKMFNERILEDLYNSDNEFSVILLRYFNPIGAHNSGLIGETPNGIPNNLVPYIAQVATGKRDFLRVWGNDYNTVDGTGVRDYIHVVDLALGHIKAVEYAMNHLGVEKINLGTGNGYSVLQVKDAYAKASKKDIAFEIMDRRPGDIATCYADTKKAKELLGWQAEFDIETMCNDSWNFEVKNPDGVK